MNTSRIGARIRRAVHFILTTSTIVACASSARIPEPVTAPQPPPASAPQPQSPAAPSTPAALAPIPQRSGSWSFSYAPGSYTYSLVTNATIAPLSDTLASRPMPATTTRATITISPTGETQVVEPATPATPTCDATAATIVRAQSIAPKLPAHMSAGDTWSDSTVTDGCRGSVPATSHVNRAYKVIGDTTVQGVRALQIHHADTINATGEGAEGQHRVLVSATGTAIGDIFVDTQSGRLVGATSVQTTTVNVSTSGRSNRFVQHVTEQLTLVTQ